jgi:hypothetical protein
MHHCLPAACAQIINETLDGLIAKCKALVEEEDADFGEDFLSERDPSILHFLLASGGGRARQHSSSSSSSKLRCPMPHRFQLSGPACTVQCQQRAVPQLAVASKRNMSLQAYPTALLPPCMRLVSLAAGDEISSKQLRDDLMTMLIAGHETTAAVLTWTMYMLAQHPEVLERIRTEVGAGAGCEAHSRSTAQPNLRLLCTGVTGMLCQSWLALHESVQPLSVSCCCCCHWCVYDVPLATVCCPLTIYVHCRCLCLQVDAVCGDGLPTVEQLRELRFTTRVINESMRLYPQPPVLIRR